MTLYCDASVGLRALLRDGPVLRQWGTVDPTFTSALFQVEARRTLDRLRVTQAFSDEEVADAMFKLLRMERSLTILDCSAAVLERAGRPLPTTVGTLDAIHLASALILRDGVDEQLVFATHDRQQAVAAVAFGFEVIGIDF